MSLPDIGWWRRVVRALVRAEKHDPLGNLLGLLRHWAKDQPATVEEMDEAIRTRVAKKSRDRETS